MGPSTADQVTPPIEVKKDVEVHPSPLPPHSLIRSHQVMIEAVLRQMMLVLDVGIPQGHREDINSKTKKSSPVGY